MSSHNEQLQPTPFDVAQPAPVQAPAAADSKRREGTPSWVLPALGGLLLLAVLVIFWLPDRINAPVPEPAAPGQAGAAEANLAQPGQATGQAAQVAAGPDVSPWSDAQAAKLRKEAQDVLAELLEVQEALEARGVKAWAPDQFSAVAALATAGDELYRNRDYAAAKARYEEGLAQLQALEAGIPAELARQLALANESLENGDLAQATAALDRADAIDPGNAEAAALRHRVEALPQLLALLERAATAEQGGDLAGAIALLKQAVALDANHQRSGSELARVTAAYQEQRFNEAMSAGYAALDANQFDTARKAFRQAAALQSGSSEAASALQEVETAATAHRLAGLQDSSARAEQAEQWEQAVTAYEQAQKIDPNVLFAREGLQRSRDRARLDKQFRAAIDDPLRLGDVAVADAAEKMLQFARKISPRGPVLSKQISQLERLLQQANTPVKVALRSDQQTEVVVYKVAKLGKFDQRELSLRPGNYTAVGSRIGYRDVRLDFTIKPDSPPPTLTIACTEAI
jgi:tetratricopeptide (TPR) repeat protein